MKRGINCIAILLCSVAAHAQPQLSVTKTEALIGDQLELVLEVPVLRGEEWINADVIPADTVASIEVLETYVPEQGQGLIRKRWTIAVFDTGGVRVPPVPVILDSGTSVDTLYSNDIPLQIEGIVDSSGMVPIKPIVYEAVRFSDYLPFIGGAILLGLLILAGIRWSRRPQEEPEIVEIRDEKPAHAHALIRLDHLESQQLWQKGEIKQYHSVLSHIVREYLENRYGIHALEYTTGEILAQLRQLDLGEEMNSETARMMEVEDLVKFAKAKPPVEVHVKHMSFVRDFIRRTQMISGKEEADA